MGVTGAGRGTWCHRLLGHSKEFRCIAVHRGLIVSGVSFGECLAWRIDSASASAAAELRCHKNKVKGVAVRCPLVVSGSIDESVRVWDLARRKEEGQQETSSMAVLQHNGMVHAVALGSTTVVSGTFESARSRVLVWEMP